MTDSIIELIHVTTDTTWFNEKKEKYLNSPNFKRFQKASGVNLEDLSSNNPNIKRKAQEELIKKSIILNAIRTKIGDYFCPLVYTHEFGIVDPVPEHVLETDLMILEGDMCDSLRRRHNALSYAMLPEIISGLENELKRPLVIKNIGSGMGIDVLNALMELGKTNDIGKYIQKNMNLDIDTGLLNFGIRITNYLEGRNMIPQGLTSYANKNLFFSREKADLAVFIGYICSTKDEFASRTLDFIRKTLNKGGQIVVSSSTYHMRNTDPLSSFLIQNLGLQEDKEMGYPDDPLFGWPLNFRTKEQMKNVLKDAGYKDIKVYDDANFPGRDSIEYKMISEVDCLPSIALGLKEKEYKPLKLPSKDILNKKIGYNWIAVARAN